MNGEDDDGQTVRGLAGAIYYEGALLVNSPYPDPSMNRLVVRINMDWTPGNQAVIMEALRHAGVPREAVVMAE